MRHVILVNSSSGTFEVEINECRLRNGDLAFPHVAYPPASRPDWFSAPPRSLLRESLDLFGRNPFGRNLGEIRSIEGTAAEVLKFYEACAERGGLVRMEGPAVGRAVPGFEAEDAKFRFSIDLYQHKDLTFWTTQLLEKTSLQNRIPKLKLVDRNDERAILQDTVTGEEYVAPASALAEVQPREASRIEHIVWSWLPKWVQFGFKDGSQGELFRSPAENGVETWNANISSQETWNAGISSLFPCDSPKGLFKSCLNSLDTCGFDASGV